ncbi:amidohydrolase family protein [Myxococcota bacterium]|nr:amidohydrolase family protein [Myxococcota bacterium]
MTMPNDVPIIDLMLGIPSPDQPKSYEFMQPLFMDRESREEFKFPPQYMFKDFPKVPAQSDYVKYTLDLMDRFNIERAMLGVGEVVGTNERAVRDHPDRFIPSCNSWPNEGMEGVRRIVRLYEEYGVKAVGAFPCGEFPQVDVNSPKYYPIFAKCVELDLPFCCTIGVPGPRIPMHPQLTEHIDEICWFFPDLKFVIRHGSEPWADLAVKLMLKWPNLFFSTTAFAPKHYPKAVIDYANTRGSDKVMYAGYFPSGLTLERIFGDMPNVPFRDHVWPKFLRENAIRVFNL